MPAEHAHRSDTSQAAIFTGPGELQLRELPLPALHPGEAMVRVTCCSICGSDLHTYQGAREEATPSILGHEIVGIVHEVADPPLSDHFGNALQPGDRVTWSTIIACGKCDRCDRGMPQKCRSVAKYGHEQAVGRTALSGGLAEFVLLRRGTTAIKLECQTPDQVICAANCATATVVAAFRTAGEVRDQRVMIFGAGMLGLTAAAYAKSRGASKVVVCDANSARLERALSFGADAIVCWNGDRNRVIQSIQAESGLPSFDAVFEMSGASAAVEVGCELADVAGTVTLVGTVMPCEDARLNPEQIVRRWLTIQGVHNYIPNDLLDAVTFLQQSYQRFPFEDLVEQVYPLTDVPTAFEQATRTRPIRVAIIPHRS